jgi:hypothetical protein
MDVEERVLRFLEESIELGQVEGVTKEQALALIEQVYAKPPGVTSQEIGGVLTTLAAYFAVTGASPEQLFERELRRIEQPDIMEKIRTKHDGKLVVSSANRR